MVRERCEVRHSRNGESDLAGMAEEELRRMAHTIGPDPWVLSYLSDEELQEWEARFKTEKLRRKEWPPTGGLEPFPCQGRLLEETSH